ncbi:flavoprotein [Glutamicibacter mishrai]|uniref:Flavoprotein n=1 Tax=Glutamicibacter mishrai TaxID=1775880 RepID=A0A6H0SKI8_9MICC|nr:flavoprotein [Glutamicibacter mishrai]KUM30893.1 flavoprotein [Arthrobacter sp. EpRS66]QIV87071.1 flavoprotein [Glutamicibacter mishrai]UTT39693.1 flavoprotein [Glutamicibacter mishrai]
MTTAHSTMPAQALDLSLDGFGYRKVALVLTGSAATQVMPFWLDWILAAAPHTQFRIIMRDSASRFITRHSLETRLRARVHSDHWEDEVIAEHVELAEWADLILIYPATLDYASRLASGITDSPSLLAALSTSAPVCIAPALPPRALSNPLVTNILDVLRAPKNFVVIDPVPGPSESSDIAQAWVPPPFPAVLRRLETLRVAGTIGSTTDR